MSVFFYFHKKNVMQCVPVQPQSMELVQRSSQTVMKCEEVPARTKRCQIV